MWFPAAKTKKSSSVTLVLFFCLVAAIAVALAVVTRWDTLPEGRCNPLDPGAIWNELVGEEPLTDEEQRWLDELAALELPRRHRLC